MLLLNIALGVIGIFLSGDSFGQWSRGAGQKKLFLAVFEGLAGAFFIVAALGSVQ